MEVAGANRRWRGQFRCRGSRHESAVAQLFSLIWLNNVKRAVVCFPKIGFHFPAGHTTNYSESAAGTPWLRFQCWDTWVHSPAFTGRSYQQVTVRGGAGLRL